MPHKMYHEEFPDLDDCENIYKDTSEVTGYPFKDKKCYSSYVTGKFKTTPL